MSVAASRCVARSTVLTIALLASGVSAARADIIVTDDVACEGKALGDACVVQGQPGLCQASTRARRDWSTGTTVTDVVLTCFPTRPKLAPGRVPARAAHGCASRSANVAMLTMLLGVGLLAVARRWRPSRTA